MIPDAFAWSMLLALCLDVLVGWSGGLRRVIGQPGAWIAGDRARVWENAAQVLAVAVPIALAWQVARLLPEGWGGIVLTAVLAWPFVAARSLYKDVVAVARSSSAGKPDGEARARSALESLAGGASCGVIAPLFWGALFGLPGIVGYRAVSALWSTPRLGRAAIWLRGIANWIPDWLTGTLIAIASPARGTALRTMRRDAGRFRAPHAAWPEAAMAGALGVRLSAPRAHDGRAGEDHWLNPIAGEPRAEDVLLGVRIYVRVVVVWGAILLLAALL